MHRNQLHLCDEIALVLDGRHEGARPGRRVLDEGTRKRDTGLIRIADSVCGAGIRDTGDRVNLVVGHMVALCELLAAAHAHGFDGYTLVGRRRIAVVDPEEGADAHLFAGGGERRDTLRRHHGDFAGAELAEILVAEVQIGEALERSAEALVLSADDDRCSAELVAGQVNALRGQQHNAHGAIDYILCIAEAVNQVVFPVNQRGDELRRVDDTAAHLEEGRAVVL